MTPASFAPLPPELQNLSVTTLLDSVSVGVIIHDRDMRVVWANRTAAQLLLLSPSQLVGLDSAATDWQAVNEEGESVAATERPVGVALATGKAVYGGTVGIYTRQHAARWLTVDAVPLFTTGSELPDYVMSTFTESTTQQSVPVAQEPTLSDSLEILPDAFFQLDREWRFTFVNRGCEELFERPRRYLLGHSLWDVAPVLVDGMFYEQLHRAVADAVPRRFESVFLRPSTWVEVSTFPFKKGLSVSISDVTKQQTDQAERRRLAHRNALLLESIDTGIFGLDRDGNLTFINHAASEILGYSAAYLLGKEMHSLSHHHYADGRPYPIADCPIYQTLQTGQSTRRENEVLWRSDGSSLPVTYSASPIVEGDEITGVVVSFYDITESRRRSEWQDFLANAGAILAISLDYNETVRRLRDLILPQISDWATLEASDGKGFSVALSSLPATSPHYPVAERLIREYLITGQDVGSRYVLERGDPFVAPQLSDQVLEAMAEDATHLALLRELGLASVLVVPIWSQGRRVAVLSLRRFAGSPPYHANDLEFATRLADLTTTALENSRLFSDAQRFRETLDRTQDVVFLVDSDSLTVAYANMGLLQLVGYKQSELDGMPVLSLLAEFDEQRLRSLLDHLRQQVGDSEVLETLIRRRDGTLIPLEMTIQYVTPREAQGTFVVIARDITQRREADKLNRERTAQLGRLTRALARSNAELDQFAYIASHDLKAPLRGISNLSQWIEEDLAEHLTDDTLHHMELLRSRVSRLEALIDGLLQYSRVGRTRQQVVTIDVEEMVKGIVDLLAPPPGMTIKVVGQLPQVTGERAPLQMVLMNLISNAIKHHDRDEGRITVSGQALGDMAEFTVSDDGPGIAPQFHDKVFVIFQRLQPKDSVEGTGLGLSMAKKQVERQGGAIRLDSDGEHGTTFTFTWPLDSRSE